MPETPAPAPSALLLTGTVGAGKTTTAYAVGDLLAAQGVPHAIIDLDEIRRLWPAPAGDPFQQAIELENLAALAATYRRAGAQRLVLAGVVEGEEGRAAYARALGGPPIICRLEVPLERVHIRLRERHEPGEGRDWHLARSGELAAILARSTACDHVVPVGGEPPADVAARVLKTIGWACATP